jgi:hypothetical protein
MATLDGGTFIKNTINKSYERLVAETIEAQNSTVGVGNGYNKSG